MACPSVITGSEFLIRVIAHIDCQAQVIGSYGYRALGEPGSMAATVANGLLTVFVALFGFRLLFGPAPAARDVVHDVIKVGLVLSLAFSWPAFRTVIYDVVVDGPGEIAAVIASPEAPLGSGLVERLQETDNGIVKLIEVGTGRQSGAKLQGATPGSSSAGSGLQDDNAFGWARLLFLGSVVASVGLLRLAAGLLLALAPLMAGLLLFEGSRGLFAGWLRGLVLTMLGSVGATVVLGVQLAVIEPWLADALQLRNYGYATPATPTELFALMLAFGIVQFAMIGLLARVAFYRGWPTIPSAVLPRHADPLSQPEPRQVTAGHTGEGHLPGRAQSMAGSIATRIRREEQAEVRRLTWSGGDRSGDPVATGPAGEGEASRASAAPDRLGDSWRRTSQRGSAAARNRDTLS